MVAARRGGLALDQALRDSEAGEIGAAAVPGLVPDPVQVGGHGADADGEPVRDLRVGVALGDQGDQFPFPRAQQLPGSRPRGIPPGRPS